jgi:membrane protein implicated in regulation of membrane protease activity
MAMIAFVALGVLSWTTLSDQRIRFAALAVLALFAFKTWVRRNDVMHPEKKQDVEQ